MKDIEINVDVRPVVDYVKEHPVCSLFLAAETLFVVAGLVSWHSVTGVLVQLGALCFMAAVTVALSRI